MFATVTITSPLFLVQLHQNQKLFWFHMGKDFGLDTGEKMKPRSSFDILESSASLFPPSHPLVLHLTSLVSSASVTTHLNQLPQDCGGRCVTTETVPD